MRKLLIATHGYLADGVKSSINILCGEKSEVTYLNAYVEDGDIKENVKDFFNEYKPEDEVIVFTDLYGGSVNQICAEYINKENVHLIAGFNLALVLELLYKDEPLTNEIIRKEVENARNQLVYVNDIELKEEGDDFF
ncbi:PTS sugar transporter subunit IIA [Clostridium paraputrificum]|uniref:PTS sugar transporter subunit IIA n=1 Tax=Clostridium paraputrificum TaxID=29363 RepID=UPI0018991B39|nr:PTS sugar transporter subunit IIA [Clostridium paraputrificum]MDB2109344.1 PTS sugar transporter subunit IIA [Clostridium paraputrificum]